MLGSDFVTGRLIDRADWHAAPLSGAALLDLAIQESGTGEQLSPLHDSIEVTASAESISIADGVLAEAEALFTEAGSPAVNAEWTSDRQAPRPERR